MPAPYIELMVSRLEDCRSGKSRRLIINLPPRSLNSHCVSTIASLASFNINNINRRLRNLLDWLREADPGIVCIQELKATDDEFPAEAIRQAGYHEVWPGERSWNGVAILARWAPVVTRTDLPGDDGDGQCRYLEAALAACSSPRSTLPMETLSLAPNLATSLPG